MLRLGSSLAVLAAIAGSAGACKSKGNGIGTAPTDIPCPATRPTAAAPCPDPAHIGAESNVCNYSGTCADPAADGEAFFFCPGGTNAAWKCIDATETGPLDASSDGGDAETATDADVGPDADDGETADADETALDADETTTDADAADADVIDASDAALDGDGATD